MTLLRFTHANNKVPVYVLNHQIFSFYASDASKSTYLLATGGAIIPVLENVEEVKLLLESTKSEKEPKNVRK